MKTKLIDRDAMRDARMKPDDYRGATSERMGMAQGHFSVGDDKMGTKVIHLLDSPLNRTYTRLVRAAKTSDAIERLGAEYAALRKYARLFDESGMVGSVGSVDFNRTYSPSPFGRTFLPASERQCDDRLEYHRATNHLSHQARIVVDNVCCHENSLELSGYCIGKGSKTRAITAAEMILRDSGYRLAEMWKMI
jgi:hypothetical protein